LVYVDYKGMHIYLVSMCYYWHITPSMWDAHIDKCMYGHEYCIKLSSHAATSCTVWRTPYTMRVSEIKYLETYNNVIHKCNSQTRKRQ